MFALPHIAASGEHWIEAPPVASLSRENSCATLSGGPVRSRGTDQHSFGILRTGADVLQTPEPLAEDPSESTSIQGRGSATALTLLAERFGRRAVSE